GRRGGQVPVRPLRRAARGHPDHRCAAAGPRPDEGHPPPVTRYVGTRVPRVNDAVLLAGGARFVDDLSLPAMLHAAVVRSPVAHGRLVRFDADAAPGVTVLGPEAFDDLRPQSVIWHLGDQWQDETQVVDRHVRYVGQPLGLVVASSRYEAEDALDH